MAYYETYMPNEYGALQKVVINAGVGFVLPYYGETAPPGTLACDGSEISRAAYDELFQVLGTKAGAGDGSTTFNLPDFRGDFIRGLGGDNAGDLGVEQGDAIRNFVGRIGIVYDMMFSVVTGAFSPVDPLGTGKMYTTSTSADYIAAGADLNPSLVVPTAPENRPVNVALLWCIIYE